MFRLESFVFQKLSNGVRYIMNKNNHNALVNYIDDLIYCGLSSSIHQGYKFFLSVLQDFDLSIKKFQPPDKKNVCLGILFDTVQHTVYIPFGQFTEVIKMCEL